MKDDDTTVYKSAKKKQKENEKSLLHITIVEWLFHPMLFFVEIGIQISAFSSTFSNSALFVIVSTSSPSTCSWTVMCVWTTLIAEVSFPVNYLPAKLTKPLHKHVCSCHELMARMCECRVTCNSLVDIMSDTEALCWTKGACPNEARVDRSSEYHVNKDKQGSEMTVNASLCDLSLWSTAGKTLVFVFPAKPTFSLTETEETEEKYTRA